jgi:hypothetical protein
MSSGAIFLGSCSTVPGGRQLVRTKAVVSFFIASYGTCLVFLPLTRTRCYSDYEYTSDQTQSLQ